MDGIIARGSAHTSQEKKVGKHYHDNTNIVFILEGGCIEKREQSTFERVPADILLLHAGETHETVMADCQTKYLTLDIEPGVLARYDMNEQLLLSAIQKSPDAKFLIIKIFGEILCNDAFSADSVHMLLLEFAAISTIQHKKTRPAWIRTIEALLQDNWDEPVSLKELSKAAGVNPITVSKHFPAYFGCTLGMLYA